MTTKKLRIAFMGTPDFSAPALEALIRSGHDVLCVYTQPARPKGRGQKIQASPIQQIAEAHNIPVHTPLSLKKDAAARAEFAAYDLDVAIVAAYGLLLPLEILQAPKHGCLNIHASLLPRWRGASPIQRSIWAGDAQSGITIMQMDEGLDTGGMIEKRSIALRPQTTAQSLHDELSALGGTMIIDVINRLAVTGSLTAEPQDNALTCYAPLLKKDDGRVDWSQTAIEIDRQIRALTPWPGVWTSDAADKRMKIIAVEVVDEHFTEPPGTLVDSMGHVVCGQGTALRLLRVHPDNAKTMDFLSALNGGYLKTDHQFF